jgi:NADH:ubiquinone oxidoreductase subunit 6 (subunit J)
MKNVRLLTGAIVVMAALTIIGTLIDDKNTAFFVWSLSALPIAALFYSVRRKNRVVYGLVEMAVAIAALYFLFLHFGPGELTVEQIATRTVAIMAVVYVIVRALDNIGEGLRQGSSLEAYWSRLFPKVAK